jgi:hypothetical protein
MSGFVPMSLGRTVLWNVLNSCDELSRHVQTPFGITPSTPFDRGGGHGALFGAVGMRQ